VKIDVVKTRWIVGLIVISLLLLGTLVIPNYSHQQYINIPLHTFLETAGAIASFVIGTIIFLQYEKNRTFNSFHYLTVALIVMGVFDGFHAMVKPGELFVWLHSLAVFSGGLFSIKVWMRPKEVSLTKYRAIPIIMVHIALAVSILSILYQDALPAMMKSDGSFTQSANMLNFMGALGFVISTIYLRKKYFETAELSYLLFGGLTLLFSVAGILFFFSYVWDPTWWFWHFLRFIAYLIALFIVIIIFREHQEKMEESNRLLKESQVVSQLGHWGVDFVTQEVTWSDSIYMILERDRSKPPVSAEEYINQYVHPDEREVAQERFARSMSGETHTEFIHRAITEKGRLIWISLKHNTQYDAQGVALSTFGTLQDVSTQKQLEAQFETIFNYSKDGLGILDLESNFIDFNDAYLELTGLTREELKSKSCISMSIPEDVPRAQKSDCRSAGEGLD
jgi:PAS domain-containing protein